MSGLDDVIEHPWLSAVWATSGDENEENEDPPEDCKLTNVPQIFRPTPRLTHFILIAVSFRKTRSFGRPLSFGGNHGGLVDAAKFIFFGPC